ncbi:MAG: ZIP family metal transporter [Solirubrobacteraceae bacterium]|nr:ZIP family metal transporter [Solirubrobacteraceae bacterium]
MTAQIAFWIVVSGLGTAVGGLALLAFHRPPARALLDALLGFTAGVMLAAVAFSLLVPGLEAGGWGAVTGGFLLGAGFLLALDVIVPHAHAELAERGRVALEDVAAGRRAFMLLSALTIHNVPEGLAVGAAFAAGGPDLGIPLALAIGIQNVPEGFAAGAPLLANGVSRGRAAGVAALTGMVEPPAAFLAFFAVEWIDPLLPWALGFAGGAMLYVVVDELIPEAERHGNERLATLAAMGGFALLLALDNALG